MIEFLNGLPYKTYTGLFLCSLFAGSWLTPQISWLSRGLGLSFSSDRNNSPVASLGGLAVGLPFISGISLLLLLKNQVSENMYMDPMQMRGLFFSSSLILAVGFLHDLIDLKRFTRLFLQASTASLAYYYGFRIEAVNASSYDWAMGINLTLTVIWICSLANISDILNRIHQSFIPATLLLIISLLLVAFSLDQYRTIVVCSLLAGSLLGTLTTPFALRPNLGSTGSFFIGFILAITLLQSHIITGIQGMLFFVFGAGLIIAVLAFKKSTFRPGILSINRDQKLYQRKLQHFREAYILSLNMATNTQEAWRDLCQAAIEFDIIQLFHHSSTKIPLREWGDSTATDIVVPVPLERSGGMLHIGLAYAVDGFPQTQSQILFMDLVKAYDSKLEDLALSLAGRENSSLRVVIVNRYFSGMSATGQIVEDLAEDLVATGAAITVLTGGITYDSATSIPGVNEDANGVHVYRVPPTHFGRSSWLNRLMDFVFFYIFAFSWVIKTPAERYTHIIVFTDPPLIALVGYLAKKVKGWKFVYNVQDLYPDTALALGILKEGLVLKICRYISKKLLCNADALLAIGDNMAAYIRTTCPQAAPICVIPNWADGNKIHPVKNKDKSLLQELNLKDVYTIMYAGNMGLAQEINALIELIRTFKERRDIQFIFMGGGVRRKDIEQAVADYNIDNAFFIEYQPKKNLSNYLGLADLGIVTLAPTMEGLAIPTRTFSYMAAGLPIMAIAHRDSELKMLEKWGLGVLFPPDLISEATEYINQKIRTDLRSSSQHIRTHFESHCDRPLRTQKYRELLLELINK